MVGRREPTHPEARPRRPTAAEDHGSDPRPSGLIAHSCSADLWTRPPAISKPSSRPTPPVGEVGLTNWAADRILRRADIVVIFSPSISQSSVTLRSPSRAGSSDRGDGNRLQAHPILSSAQSPHFSKSAGLALRRGQVISRQASPSAAPSPALWPQASASPSAA